MTSGSVDMSRLYNNKTVAIVYHIRADITQRIATLKQLSKFSNIPLSVQFNAHDEYQALINSTMAPYVFVGLIPNLMTKLHNLQGWNVNGKDFTFVNCDTNPNSYFAALFNVYHKGYTNYVGYYNALMFAWYDLSTAVSTHEYLPRNFFTPFFEIHHGGCGGFSRGTNVPDIQGVAVGLRSEITCAYPIPIQHASLSYSGLSPGNSVTYTCDPGYIMVSGDAVRTCHGLGGWTGAIPKCQELCDFAKQCCWKTLTSGLYQINRGGKNFHIYCSYENGNGYVYVSPSAPSDEDLKMASLSDDSSLVKVIHRRHDGKQYEATIQQITAFNTLVSVQFNKHDGYKGILNAAMGPYVFTGFIPLSHNVKDGVQGWKINEKEFTFTNCDGNTNSSFVVLFNAKQAIYTSYKGWMNNLMYAWYDLSTPVPVSDSLPEAMFSNDYEIHHGGCGGYSIGTTKSDVTGVTISQRFIITCSEPDDVRGATKTFGDVKPGSISTLFSRMSIDAGLAVMSLVGM